MSGGPAGREGLLVGLKSGQVSFIVFVINTLDATSTHNSQVFRIFLDNSLPLMITSVVSAVRCLDINANRTKIAVVDDTGRLVVRDIVSDTLLYQVCSGYTRNNTWIIYKLF